MSNVKMKIPQVGIANSVGSESHRAALGFGGRGQNTDIRTEREADERLTIE